MVIRWRHAGDDAHYAVVEKQAEALEPADDVIVHDVGDEQVGLQAPVVIDRCPDHRAGTGRRRGRSFPRQKSPSQPPHVPGERQTCRGRCTASSLAILPD